jgi:hypothetical protein
MVEVKSAELLGSGNGSGSGGAGSAFGSSGGVGVGGADHSPFSSLTTSYENKQRRDRWAIRVPNVMAPNFTVKPIKDELSSLTNSTGPNGPAGGGSGALSDSPKVGRSASDNATAMRHMWTVRLKVAPKTFVDAQLTVDVRPISEAKWKKVKVTNSQAHRLSHCTVSALTPSLYVLCCVLCCGVGCAKAKPDAYSEESEVQLYGHTCTTRARTVYTADYCVVASYTYPGGIRTAPGANDDTRSLPDVLMHCLQSLTLGD